MGDRLGIQVAVDILSSSAFFPWQSGIDIVLDVIQFHLIIDGKIFSKKGLTWPGLEQSNPYKGIAGQRSSSIAKHAVHLPAFFGIICLLSIFRHFTTWPLASDSMLRLQFWPQF